MADEDAVDVSNDAWFEAHFVDLVDRYPRRWIAVADGEVIGSGITKEDAQAEGRAKAPGRVFSVYFVPGSPFR